MQMQTNGKGGFSASKNSKFCTIIRRKSILLVVSTWRFGPVPNQNHGQTRYCLQMKAT